MAKWDGESNEGKYEGWDIEMCANGVKSSVGIGEKGYIDGLATLRGLRVKDLLSKCL